MCREEIPSFIKCAFGERSPTENFLITFKEGRCVVATAAYISNYGICGMFEPRPARGDHAASVPVISRETARSRAVVWGWLRPTSSHWKIPSLSWTPRFGKCLRV